MQLYQREFLAHALRIGALRFGDFELKSGRRSPYFFNTGLFNTGTRLTQLARAYVKCILDVHVSFDLLYGPAYKGITLVTAVSMIFASDYHREVSYAFNRKEAKRHGEGGDLIGSPLEGRVLILDDVITAGGSVQQALDVIYTAGSIPAGIVVALDRQERGQTNYKNIPVFKIITIENIIDFLRVDPAFTDQLNNMQEYYKKYQA